MRRAAARGAKKTKERSVGASDLSAAKNQGDQLTRIGKLVARCRKNLFHAPGAARVPRYSICNPLSLARRRPSPVCPLAFFSLTRIFLGRDGECELSDVCLRALLCKLPCGEYKPTPRGGRYAVTVAPPSTFIILLTNGVALSFCASFALGECWPISICCLFSCSMVWENLQHMG
jgi:hypothetical protein